MSRKFLLLASLLLPLGLAGCFDGDGSGSSMATADLRVLHASPDAPAVDLEINQQAFLENQYYLSGTSYKTVPAVGFDLRIKAANGPSLLDILGVNLAADTRYTAIAANTLANLEVIVLDDTTAGPAAGNAMVRVAHMAPAAPAVDVYAAAPGTDIATLTPAVSNAAFTDATGYLEIPAGEYEFTVTAAGTTNVVYRSQAVTLDDGAIVTAAALEHPHDDVSPILLGLLTGQAADPILHVVDQRAALRVAHLSPDAPNIDVLIDDVVVLSNVAFGTISGYQLSDSSVSNLKVNLTGTSTTLIDRDINPLADVSYTVSVVDFAASVSTIASADNLSDPGAGQSKLRVVHASPDAPNVDVYINGVREVPNIPFKEISNYLLMPSGVTNIRVAVAGSNTTVLSASPDLADGGIYTLFAADEVASLQAILVQDK
ncbi:MAG: DUF4397 domain-containing protein [Gammaproteobacteria bacterium]|nr:DUF4397 domain-containing protein [Gammaproteobacteria bacterium]